MTNVGARASRFGVWRAGLTAAVSLVLGVSAVGCSTDVQMDGSEAELGRLENPLTNCGTALGAAPLDNSCGHGFVGPFGDSLGVGTQASPLAANANVNFTGATPRFNEVQTIYRVTLPGPVNNNRSAIKFTPTVTQDYAIGTSADVAVSVLAPGGASVSALINQNVATACAQIGAGLGAGPPGSALSRLRVFTLTAGVEYRVVFGPASVSSFNVLIDEPNDFLNLYFADADTDTYGDPNFPGVSECTTPAGYVGNDLDCDDTNASIQPNASEVNGDGIDNDCDTLIDGETATSDLVLVDVAPVTALPGRMLVGQSVNVGVRTVVSNNDPIPTDGRVTVTATASAGGTITPASSVSVQNNIRLSENRELVTTYAVGCTTPGLKTFTIGAEIQPARAGDTDPNPGNNIDTLTFNVDCTACMHATKEVLLADRTHVSVGKLLSGTSFQLGSDKASAVVVADVAVNGNAFLRTTSKIQGNLTYAGIVNSQDPLNVAVTGTVTKAPVTVPPITRITFPTGTADITANSGASTWTPGTRRDGTANPGANLTLTAGVYNFRSLTVLTDVVITLNTSGGDIFINTQNGLNFGDRSRVNKTGGGQAMFYSNSTGVVRLGTDIQQFNASVTAPDARLNVFSRTLINGCMAASTIAFDTDVTLNSTSIPGSFPVTPNDPPPSTCSNGVQDGTETGVDCGGLCQNACPPPPLPLSVTFPVTSNWATGYCVNIAVRNNGTRPTIAWFVTLNTNQSAMYQHWNGNYTGTSGVVSVTPMSFNNVINPGQTITSPGFCANRTGGSTTSLPSLVSVSGY
jgi:hypothetical protein